LRTSFIIIITISITITVVHVVISITLSQERWFTAAELIRRNYVVSRWRLLRKSKS